MSSTVVFAWLPSSCQEEVIVPNGPATRTFSLTVYLTRAPDVAGQWVGHCLEIDVVSQGDSMRHAYEMTREAVEMVILDDLNSNREPALRSAPREEWEAAYQSVQSANPKLYSLTELFEAESTLRKGALAPLIMTFVAAGNVRPAALQEIDTHPTVRAA